MTSYFLSYLFFLTSSIVITLSEVYHLFKIVSDAKRVLKRHDLTVGTCLSSPREAIT